MERFKFIAKTKIENLPKTSGVYAFASQNPLAKAGYKGKNRLLYIGKAVNIKERVKNHFFQPTHRDALFINEVTKIGFLETNSEIEALLLEAQLIKKFQPKFNVVWRDDKNYFYVAISKTPLPKVYIAHQKPENSNLVGPFVEGRSLKKVLQLLRKIFPYYTVDKHGPKPCLWCQIGLCPGPNPDKKLYRKNINNLISVLEGKKQKVLRDLKKDMKKYSASRDFENAAKTRDQIFSLEKIISHAHILEPDKPELDWPKTENILQTILGVDSKINRIEGYDISNTQGNQATASMVVFVNGHADKNSYRKFKIKTIEGPNDTAMIKEALIRRLAHSEWPLPEAMLIDGGKGQLSVAIKVKEQFHRIVPLIISIAKKNNELFIEGKKEPLMLKNLPREIYNLILQIRDESHRFAIAYHKKLRERELLSKT